MHGNETPWPFGEATHSGDPATASSLRALPLSGFGDLGHLAQGEGVFVGGGHRLPPIGRVFKIELQRFLGGGFRLLGFVVHL